MARSAEEDVRTNVRGLAKKGVQSGQTYKNPVLIENAL